MWANPPPASGTVENPANPGAGNNWSVTVPNNVLLHLRGVSFQFLTDANVANRYPTLLVNNGTADVIVIPSVVLQTASVTYQWCFSIEAYPITTAVNNHATARIPRQVVMAPGWTLSSSVWNLQAGDTITNIYIVWGRHVLRST